MTWYGEGVEQGTNERVTIEGDSPEDVRSNALARVYPVALDVIHRPRPVSIADAVRPLVNETLAKMASRVADR